MARPRADPRLGLSRGTGLAATASPAPSAPIARLAAFLASGIELATPPRWSGSPLLDDGEDDDQEEQAIAAEFQRRLAGLQHLPRAARAAALRAAKLWHQGAFRLLRDKRAAARQARKLAQRWQIPPPA